LKIKEIEEIGRYLFVDVQPSPAREGPSHIPLNLNLKCWFIITWFRKLGKTSLSSQGDLSYQPPKRTTLFIENSWIYKNSMVSPRDLLEQILDMLPRTEGLSLPCKNNSSGGSG
jgi:hypothetical protein